MVLKNNDNLYYTLYGSIAIIIVILYNMGIQLPTYTWSVYGLIGVLLAIFINFNK